MTDDASEPDEDAHREGTTDSTAHTREDAAEFERERDWWDDPAVDTDRDDTLADEIRVSRDDVRDPGSDSERGRRDDEAYRVPLDLSGSAADDDWGADEADATANDDEDDPYAPEPSSTPIDPGDPSLEHALFVVLGIVAMVLVMFQLGTLVF